MKLLLIFIFFFISLSKSTIIEQVFFNSPNCVDNTNNTQHTEYASLCNFQNLIQVKNSEILFFNRNISTSKATCDLSSYESEGFNVTNNKCQNFEHPQTGALLSTQIKVVSSVESYESLIELLPENSCNDIYFVDSSSCNSNFYVYSYINNKCNNNFQNNMTVSFKVTCNSQYLTIHSYPVANCQGESLENGISNPVYPNGTCNPAVGPNSQNIFHSFYYKPNSDSDTQPNNSYIEVIPSIFILLSILISLLI